MDRFINQNNPTYAGMVRRINNGNVGIIKFTYWRHFSFMDILGYAGAYFVDNNSYEIDRVFISGEFIGKDGKKFSATFALNIDEIITIVSETSDIRWEHIS
jgi:hypothetical protein